MASLIDLLDRLEKRIFLLEEKLGIVTTPDLFIHPKSGSQAQRVSQKRLDELKEKK